MSTVSAATAANTPSAYPFSAANVDYQSFIRLLVAELSNQNPLEPADPTQHVAQLAAFSNVEQSLQINNKISELLNTVNLSLAGSIIGRTITSADGAVTGTVNSVSVISGGLVAVLDDGQEIRVTNGIEIS